MNRLKNFLILGCIGIFLFLIFVLKIHWDCPIKTFLHLACPACGLTRSFRSIFSLQMIESFSYNLLGIPLFIGMIIAIGFLIYDLIFNTDHLIKKVSYFFEHYALWIFVILILNMIINNIRHI